MKCVPLWQPWSSLVAIGAKKIETRHWPAPPWIVGHRVVIHACKTRRELWQVGLEPFLTRLREAKADGRLQFVNGELPLGALICTAVVDRCTEITEETAAQLRERNPDEFAFGNYSLEDGPRYAWVLRDVERLPAPIPYKGSQGIFDVPDEVLGLAGPNPLQESLL